MRKDESGVKEWCKHTNNIFGTKPRSGGRRFINKRVRLNVKKNLKKELMNT